MESLEKFKELRERFREAADFVMVYISEAHPAERGDWKKGATASLDLNQPKVMRERLDNATELASRCGDDVEVYVDHMENEANMAYGAIPER